MTSPAVAPVRDYTSPTAIAPETIGIFYWVATYSGDVNNFPSGSACNADPMEFVTP